MTDYKDNSAAPPAQGWQPGETAPTDSRWILVWLPSPFSHCEQVRWLETDEVQGYWQVLGDGWRLPIPFTHWMPLPAPPVPAMTENICIECGKTIEEGSKTAIGRDGEMHYRCFKVGTAHGREVRMVRCGNCYAMKPEGETCFQCGVSERVG